MAVALSVGFKNRMRPPYVLGDESLVSSVLSIGRRHEAAKSCRFARRQRLMLAAAMDCQLLT
jgi:hypothetical protein